MTLVETAELHRRQQTFRQVLDAFARPGTVGFVAPEPAVRSRPAALEGSLDALARVFIDQAVSFGIADTEADDAERYLASETHAVRASCRDANFVIVPVRADAATAYAAVYEATCGMLISPEKGATVFVGCTCVSGDAARAVDLLQVEVRGPGVRDVNRFWVDRLAWAQAREARNDEFPCGIDVVLVDGAGNFVAIPRSSQVSLEEVC